MILAVEGNFLVLARRQTQHFESQQLQCAQQFSAPVEQQG